MGEKKQEDQLKKLLGKAGSESPSEGFTGRVMENIQAQEETELAKERITAGIVQKAGTQSPTPDFTHSVMERVRVRAGKPVAYAPVIGKKGWLLTTFFFLALTVPVVVLNGQAPESTVGATALARAQRYLDIAMEALYGAIGNIVVSVPLLYGLLALALLFLADWALRKPAIA